jgi:uncharacterized protein YukE
MSDLQALESIRNTLTGIVFEMDPFMLGSAIDAALAQPAPAGSPAAIRAQAQAYGKAATQSKAVADDIQEVATSSLPKAWRGQVADSASQAVTALSTEIGTIESTLSQAANALNGWADVLEWAQNKDTEGRAQLENARGQAASGFDVLSTLFGQALAAALAGLDTRIAAAQALTDNSPQTAGLLDQYTNQARAQDVTTGDLDPLSAVVLATAADPGGLADNADILTPTALTRASQRLDAMSTADQAAFEKLLSEAKSPQEAAYLYKALSAGYNLQQVEAFDAAIHPHGANTLWLAEHLTPDLNNADSTAPSAVQWTVGYQGAEGGLYNQGDVGDCVAASTVIAQASLDPILMLGLTTGYGQPKGSNPPPGDDSAAALQQRLQQIYLKEYAVGRNDQSSWEQFQQWMSGSAGISPDGENALANTLLSNSTGTSYHYQGLGSTSDRQAAVTQIVTAVDSGKPVPFDVTNGNEGHQMVIIGHNGDELEVYNPWGFTQWISESQFVNNDLASLTLGASGANSGFPTADGVELPQ